MNFPNDLSKIPINPAYSIPGITDLVGEVQHSHAVSNLPMQHTENRHEMATKLLQAPDSAFMSHIMDAVTGNQPEYRDNNVAAGPLFQPQMQHAHDVYSRNMVPSGMNPNIPMSHAEAYPQHPQITPTCSVPTYPLPNDPTAAARAIPLRHGTHNRPVVKPVQAVAPQPRNPRQIEKIPMQQPEAKHNIYQEKTVQDSGVVVGQMESVVPEENPKICLKIRRTKKSKSKSKEKNSGDERVEYGVVSAANNSSNSSGPLKLKLCRVKTPSSAETQGKGVEEAFTVSSLTAPSPSRHRDSKPVDGNSQKQVEDAASAMIKQVFNSQHTQSVPLSISKPKSSEKQSHQHKLQRSGRTHPLSAEKQHSAGFSHQGQSGHLSGYPGLPVERRSSAQAQSTTEQQRAASQHSKEPNHSGFGNPPLNFQSPHSQISSSSNFASPHFTPQQLAQQYSYGNLATPPQNYTHGTPQGGFVSPQGYPSQMLHGSNQIHPPYMQQTSYNSYGQSGNNTNQILQQRTPSKPPPYTEALGFPQQAEAKQFNTNQQQQQVSPSVGQVQYPGQQLPGHQRSHHSEPQHGKPKAQHQHQQENFPQLSHQQNRFNANDKPPTNVMINQRQTDPDYKMHGASLPMAKRQSYDSVSSQQFTSKHQAYPPVNYTNAPEAYTPRNRHQGSSNASSAHSSKSKKKVESQSRVTVIKSNLEIGQILKDMFGKKGVIVLKRTPTDQIKQIKSGASGSPQTSPVLFNEISSTQNRPTVLPLNEPNLVTVNIPGIQHVRVKFIADGEEADIFKLKDVMYPDDTEISSFGELQPGTNIVAKWPMNGKLYSAVVIDPLDNTGRRFRERKPPPKPFQAQPGSDRKERRDSYNQPSVVLDKLEMDSLPADMKVSHQDKHALETDFGAYRNMADRIKDKKRQGKKRKHKVSGDASLIHVQSDDSDHEEFRSPDRKRSHKDEMRKRERRKEVESRMQTEDGAGLFHRVNSLISSIFEKMRSIDPRLLEEAMNEGSEQASQVPQCLLLSRGLLQELSGEMAKLKIAGHLSELSRKVLVRLLAMLEPNIRDGVHLKPMKPSGHSSEEQKWNRDCQLDRVNGSTEASLTAMHIMTAPYMPKAVYLDDIMERSAQLLRYQLSNTIYPEYDPVYRSPTTSSKKKGGKAELPSTASTRMKRAHYKGPKNRTILQLYNKLNILLTLWGDLVIMQPLTDTVVLQISSVGISPFFVENVRELQLSAIRLTTTVFSRYDKHRSIILEDIIQSLARLPTSKRNLRSYRLTYAEEAVDSSDDEEKGEGGGRKGSGGGSGSELQYIQMVTALVLQMVHSICHLPDPVIPEEGEATKETNMQHKIDELKIVTNYDTASRTGQNFLSVFLKKCASKSEETDYRPLFENMVHDLLATVNKPEWPASEMLLSILGRLLVHTFNTKSTEMSLRVAALDYLGVVAAKLRSDTVTSHSDVGSIKSLLQRLEEAVSVEAAMETEQTDTKTSEAEKQEKYVENESELLTRQLQYLILGYLRRNSRADPALLFAHNFYIAQWLRDVSLEFEQLQSQDDTTGDLGEQLDAQIHKLQACQHKKDAILELSLSAAVAVATLKRQQGLETEEKKLPPPSQLQIKADKLSAGLSVEDAALVTRHLASTRPFSKSFDVYLTHILRVREETAVALRTRAIKCLAEVVAVDPSIMEREDIAKGVQASLVDPSTSVREAAIDLVGKFIILKPQLVKFYYEMLTARIMDTGVSVRKRVIKILRDLCHEYPDLPQLTDACVKMIRRVNDEEGIKKLVHEVFMKMWFSPVDPHDNQSLRKKALLITDIVAANRERGYEWIEQLFKNLIDTPVRNPRVETSCKQIVDCLVQHVILFDKQNEAETNSAEPMTSSVTEEKKESQTPKKIETSKERGVRLVATIQTLVQLARIRPKLLVPHVMTLQPYLAAKCDSANDMLIVLGVCRTLELAVPLMEHPSDLFLASIEEDMSRLILTQRYPVVSAAIACLSAITCKVTFNYKLVWDCFQRLCHGLSSSRHQHQQNHKSIFHPQIYSKLVRALHIIGHFSKNFDFDQEQLKGKTTMCVKDKVYDCILYFATLHTTPQTEELRGFSVASLGLLMIQDPNMMFRSSTRELYNALLDTDQGSDRLKTQVLQNLQNYLQTEDVKMQEAAEASVKKAKQEADEHDRSTSDETATEDDIKEICDVSSGMASSVMQLFLKQVLESFFHRSVLVRHAALHTVYLTLQQGLVHPVQCVPYLIAAASDPSAVVHKEADQQLNDLNKRNSGFVHSQALNGMKFAYKLQQYVQTNNQVIRGYRETTVVGLEETTGTHKASCCHLYQMIRTDRKHRRAFLLSLLKLFDDTVKTDLSMLLFIADNLAHFPYHTLDEPLFLMSQIEVYVSVSGTNVLQSFKESLKPKVSKKEARRLRRQAKLDERARKKRQRAEENDSSSDSSSSSSSSSESESSGDDEEDDDDDDDQGAESIILRLSDADEPIKEFAHLSLACLLLLWVKHHLKTMFGFTDNKIHKYSPNEVNRANDKQCHRRRADLRFEPTRALEHLERMRQRMPCKHPDYQQAIVAQYIEFNELMNKLDPNEDDSDSEKDKKTPSKQPHSTPRIETPVKGNDEEDSDRDSDDDVTKPPAPLSAIRQSTALKTKKKPQKHHHDATGAPPEMRKRRDVQYIESSSDSDEDFQGF